MVEASSLKSVMSYVAYVAAKVVSATQAVAAKVVSASSAYATATHMAATAATYTTTASTTTHMAASTTAAHRGKSFASLKREVSSTTSYVWCTFNRVLDSKPWV